MINNSNQENSLDELLDKVEEAEKQSEYSLNECATQKAEKKGMFERFRNFMADKKQVATAKVLEKQAALKPKAKKSMGSSVKTLAKTTDDDMRKFNEFLGAIEVQLDKVEEQNEQLLKTICTLEKNNDMLLEQVTNLTRNNNQLTEQYNNMKKREKIAKIMAIIAATFSIGLAVFNIIFNFILPNI